MNEESAGRVEIDRHRRPRGDRTRILVTNDDGVEAPGIRILAAALAQVHDVILVAPEDDRSGSGTGIGQFDPTRGVDVTPVEISGVETSYALAGPPGLAVMSAMLGAFGDVPDLVVSGINAGINTGHSVVHSGTVGAVLTARTFGVPGLAVSLGVSDPWEWATAARVACACVDWMAERKDGSSTYNLNVPGRPAEDLLGVRWADLDEFGYFRVAIADVPGRRVQFEVGAQDATLDPGSDTALLSEGFSTLTPLTTVEPAPFPSYRPPQIETDR